MVIAFPNIMGRLNRTIALLLGSSLLLLHVGCGDLDGPVRGYRRPGDVPIGPRKIIVNNGGPTDPNPNPNPAPPPPPADGMPAPHLDAGVAPPPPTPDTGTSPGTDNCGQNPTEQQVFKLLNEARVKRGLTAYTCDPFAVKAARGHSQYMCNTKIFSHYANGTPSSRCKAAGATFSSCGENIAWGYKDPQAVHTGWMNSSGHRAAMLSKSFERVGVGYVLCNGKTPYWTENFLK
jgi:uncharacterized protein YkwD